MGSAAVAERPARLEAACTRRQTRALPAAHAAWRLGRPITWRSWAVGASMEVGSGDDSTGKQRPALVLAGCRCRSCT